jgi:hypothetical protein
MNRRPRYNGWSGGALCVPAEALVGRLARVIAESVSNSRTIRFMMLRATGP